MGDLQTHRGFSYWGTSLSLSVTLKRKERLSSMSNDSTDHSIHDVINLPGIAVGGLSDGAYLLGCEELLFQYCWDDKNLEQHFICFITRHRAAYQLILKDI